MTRTLFLEPCTCSMCNVENLFDRKVSGVTIIIQIYLLCNVVPRANCKRTQQNYFCFYRDLSPSSFICTRGRCMCNLNLIEFSSIWLAHASFLPLTSPRSHWIWSTRCKPVNKTASPHPVNKMYKTKKFKTHMLRCSFAVPDWTVVYFVTKHYVVASHFNSNGESHAKDTQNT